MKSITSGLGVNISAFAVTLPCCSNLGGYMGRRRPPRWRPHKSEECGSKEPTRQTGNSIYSESDCGCEGNFRWTKPRDRRVYLSHSTAYPLLPDTVSWPFLLASSLLTKPRHCTWFTLCLTTGSEQVMPLQPKGS